ncbi:Pyrroline-5-carboxylate reductase [Pirellula sp. SH-Sr6A]|uniref:pyrroline-5-carboxylate reductase n=1 Tax=Pirellula sp. SH-Sr6A TaxID=1632865 RepID=UPI00078B18A5|nr:pyrroline-5-carboxylate reductase [Pirellula sp. SH-Sr6A]AMV34928.1 Pyrroline-5-carboxylate reductase [Pirellula sp. SH-Sr6A]
MSNTIGFLGGGQMATAIAKGVIAAGLAKPSDLVIYEPNATQQTRLRELFPECTLPESTQELFDKAARVVLAVKPQVLAEIAISLRHHTRNEHLLVSIAAGIPLKKLSDWFESERVIRVMPNTPCQSRQGASGIAVGKGVSPQDAAWCESIFGAVGRFVRCTDDQLHAVTGLSGSGPAYVLMMIEALSDGGVMSGLSRQTALELAVQTVLGAATMVQETGTHPAVLREQVTSPAGTTASALAVLERAGFRSALIDAVVAASQRSRELS